METSLHKELKAAYADDGAQLEAPLANYRIDVICGDELVEIQHGKLAAIRDKVADLVQRHRVLVVKPLVARKRIVRRSTAGGKVTSRRWSPKRATILEIFDELVYFTRVFPHPNLVLEVPLVEIEEWRYPGHGRRRRWRKNDHQIEDQKLLQIDSIHRFRTASDLLKLVPRGLPVPFHTGHLASALQVDRWVAQRIAYCFRETGAVTQVGKDGNALLYEMARASQQAA